MNENYELIQKGISYGSPDSIAKCKLCGNIFTGSIHNLNRKNYKMCPFCEVVTKNATKEQAEFKLKQKNECYEIIDFRSMESATVKHKCGYINENANISRILKRNTNHCINCSHMSIAYTPEYVKNEIKELTNGEYEVLSDYERESKPFLIKHNLCGHEWMVRRRNFVYRGTRCPKCSVLTTRSKGVDFLREYFGKKNILFQEEKTFNNCKDKRELPFDFFLESKNILIEYDGEMHFHKRRDCDQEYSLNKLRTTHSHDIIKNNFCKENNIDLLRIPYDLSFTEIETILDEYFEFGNIGSTTIENLKVYFNNENDYYNRYSEVE